MRVHTLGTFITYLLVHIRQKKKVALEIAAKIASVYLMYGLKESWVSHTCIWEDCYHYMNLTKHPVARVG